MNSAMLVAAKEGRGTDLWFCVFDDDTTNRRMAETKLIQSLMPRWNRAKIGGRHHVTDNRIRKGSAA